MKDSTDIVFKYIERLDTDPRFEYHHIRKDLEAKKMPEEKIKAIMVMVDEAVRAKALEKAKYQKMKSFLWLVYAMIVVTILLHIIAYKQTGNFVLYWKPISLALPFLFGLRQWLLK